MSLSEEEISRLNGASGKMDLPGDTTGCTIPEITLETKNRVLESMGLPTNFTDQKLSSDGVNQMVVDEISFLRDNAEGFAQELRERIYNRYSSPMQTIYLAIERETYGAALMLRLLRTQFGDKIIQNLDSIEPEEATFAYNRQDFSFLEPVTTLSRLLVTRQPLIPSYQPHIDSCLHQVIACIPDGAQFIMRATRGMYDVMEDHWKIIHPVNLQTDIKLESNPEEGSTTN